MTGISTLNKNANPTELSAKKKIYYANFWAVNRQCGKNVP